MSYARSIIFDVIFYVWTALCCILFVPMLLTRTTAYWANQIWISGCFFIMRHVLRLSFVIEGYHNLVPGAAIYASKHQSAWETLLFHYILSDPAIVLKKELMHIPFFGLYLKRLGMIPIARGKGKAKDDLKLFLQSADSAKTNNQPIVVFPEGTRSAVGQEGKYQSGVYSLYNHLKVPVVPVAHNAGVYWPRRTWIKKSGQISVTFLPKIEPGLDKKTFMESLRLSIEGESAKILKNNGGLYEASSNKTSDPS